MDQSTLNLVFTFVTMVAVVVGAFMVCWQYRNRHGTPVIRSSHGRKDHIYGHHSIVLWLEGRTEWVITKIRLTRKLARFFDLCSQDDVACERAKAAICFPDAVRGKVLVYVLPKKDKNGREVRLLIETRPDGLKRPIRVLRKSVTLTTDPTE